MTVGFPFETARWCVEITITHLQQRGKMNQLIPWAEKLLKENQINPEKPILIYLLNPDAYPEINQSS